jgi:hypothetical protein
VGEQLLRQQGHCLPKSRSTGAVDHCPRSNFLETCGFFSGGEPKKVAEGQTPLQDYSGGFQMPLIAARLSKDKFLLPLVN